MIPDPKVILDPEVIPNPEMIPYPEVIPDPEMIPKSTPQWSPFLLASYAGEWGGKKYELP